MGTRVGGLFCSIAIATALVGCGEPVPKTPSFQTDVRPIFEARCVRCHGAGGTLNADPRGLEKIAPPNGFLDQYDDKADCTPDAAGMIPLTCLRGARTEAENGTIGFYIHQKRGLRMPMQPAEPLSPWELEVVDNWLAEMPPAP